MPSTRARPNALPPALAGEFECERALGAGAMGQVFLARHRALGRRVAIKLISGEADRKALKRFQTEAAALAKVKHPNVCRVYSYGLLESGPYIEMEYLEGAPLDKPPKGTDPLKVMLQVAAGLDAIHAADLVHRDLKLPNIMLTAAGRAVIVDFGLVLDPNRTRVTRDGSFVGTFMCAAPETIRLDEATPATDWYAWGLNLFVICEGRFPFTFKQLLAVSEGAPLPTPAFARLKADGRVAAVLRACLREDPAARPAGAGEIRAMLKGTDGAAEAVPPDAKPPPPLPGPGEVSRTLAAMAVSAPGGTGSRPSGSRSARPGPRPRWPLLAAALLLGTFALGYLSGGNDPAPAPPPPDGPGPAGLPAASPAELRAELAATREANPNLLSPDPARWGGTVNRLPRLRAWQRWLEEGGRPDTLAAETRRELAEVGRAYRDAGLPDPTFPQLAATPLTAPISLPAALRTPYFARYALPETVTGWAGRALEQLGALLAEHARLEAELLDPATPCPPGFSPEKWARRFRYHDGSLVDFVRKNSHVESFRVGLRRWLEPGEAAYLRMHYAAARSIAAGDETPGPDTLVVAVTQIGLKAAPFLYHPAQFLPPAAVFGPAPTTPAGWAHRAFSLQVARVIRKRVTRAPGTELHRRQREALRRAIGEIPRDAAATRRQADALHELVRDAADHGDGERMARLWKRYPRVFLDAPADLKIQLYYRVAELGAGGDFPGFRLAGEERRAVRRTLEGLLAAQEPGSYPRVRALVARMGGGG